MARVWAQSQRKDGELLVMLALADFANDAGECWPSIPVLAQKARLTERQTRRVLKKLEAAGEIRKRPSNGGRNRPNHYFITLSENPEIITGKKLQGKINTVIGVTKTLVPMSGALNHHRTVSKSAKNSSRPKDSDSRVKEFLAHWAETFRGRFTEPYRPTEGKDGALVKGLLSSFDLPRLKELSTTFFTTADPWVRENAGYTIGVFASQINKLVSTSPARRGESTRREMPA